MNATPSQETSAQRGDSLVGSSAWLAGLDDAALNRQFVRLFWNRPIDERDWTYWHDDDTTPDHANHEWRPLPNFCADWRAVKKILRDSPHVIAPDYTRGLTKRERTRRVMIEMILSANGKDQPRGNNASPSIAAPTRVGL